MRLDSAQIAGQEVTMADEITLFEDEEGVLVLGEETSVEEFLQLHGMSERAQRVEGPRLSRWLEAAGEAFETWAGAVEQSGRYLKLTEESYQDYKGAGELMPTKVEGIRHIMLGKTGTRSMKWLQAEEGPGSVMMNPALLSGVSGLLAQLAGVSQAQDLRKLQLEIVDRLEEERRARMRAELAELSGAAEILEEARVILDAGGDAQKAWDKVAHLPGRIATAEKKALQELDDIAQKVQAQESGGGLRRAVADARRDVEVQVAILASCIQLKGECDDVELYSVADTKPDQLPGHVNALSQTREARRAKVLARTKPIMRQLDAAAEVANQRAILHSRLARKVIADLNSTGEVVEAFHHPLGIRLEREPAGAIAWRDALRDPQQLQTAGQEVGKGAVAVAGALAALAAVKVGSDRLGGSSRDSA